MRCGDTDFTKIHGIDVLLNPKVIVEVLSSSTEAYDRGKKFHNYKGIASFQDYVLVAQDSPHIECFSRGNNNTWILTEAIGLDATITIPSVNVQLALAEIYDYVSFESDNSDTDSSNGNHA